MESGPIDDDEVDVMLVRLTLGRMDNAPRILVAQNGLEAMQYLAAPKTEVPAPYLILLDLNMPVMDGFEMLRQLQQMATQARTVVITAYGDFANVRAAMNRGAFDFLLKPIDFADLRATIEQCVAHVRRVNPALD